MTFEGCVFITISSFCSSMGSGFGICLVLFENYLSVRRLSSQTVFTLTVRKAQLCIISLWISLTGSLLLYFSMVPRATSSEIDCEIQEEFYTQTYYVGQVVITILILVVTLVLMAQMMLIVHRSLKNLFQGEGSAADQLKQRSMQKKAKMSRLFTIITLGYVVSLGPLTLALAIDLFYPGFISTDTYKIFIVTYPLNPCMNVVVYAIKDKNFQKVCVKLMKCKIGQVDATGGSTSTGQPQTA